jgi:serine protease AprX
MTQFLRRLVLVSLLLATFSAPANTPASSDAWQTKVDPWVLDTASSGQTEFILYLREQADLSRAAQLGAKVDKGSYVYTQLAGLARRTQGPILADLEIRGLQHRSYWIANAIWVRGDLQSVQALAQRADVAHIYANPRFKMDLPDASQHLSTLASDLSSPDAIPWNISRVRAPEVWAMGYTGQGTVVGGADTGYEWDHPALIDQYRGWNGVSASHDYNWHDATDTTGDPWRDSPVPVDPYGHGTHTMGTMVGDDGLSHQIGMAPGAKWIGCRNMDYLGYGTPASYIECYEWFIAPYPIGRDPLTDGDPSKAPDAINNSWACTDGEGCPDGSTLLLAAVQAVRAAGILSVHSAGNSGPSCGTVRDPAAIYP